MPLKKRKTGGHGKMKVEIGEKFTNCLTGRVYRVGMINKEWVVLESEDGSKVGNVTSISAICRESAPCAGAIRSLQERRFGESGILPGQAKPTTSLRRRS